MNIDRPLDEIVNEARQQRKQDRKKNIRSHRNKGPKKGGLDNKDAKQNPNSKGDMDIDAPVKDSPKLRGAIKKKRRSRGGGNKMDVEIVRKNGKKPQNPRSGGDDGKNTVNELPKKVNKGAKVSVSNLDHGVTQSDISELFETVGPLKSARLFVLPDGTSSGSAEVVFEAMEDALDAIKRYNNVPLDNRPLKITLSTDSAPIRIGRGRRGRKMIVDAHGDGSRLRRSPDFRGDRDFDEMDAQDGDRLADTGRRSYGTRRGGWRRNGRGYDRRPPMDTNDMYQD